MSHMKLFKGIGLATVLVASLFVLVSASDNINCDVDAACTGTDQDDTIIVSVDITTVTGGADILGLDGDDRITNDADSSNSIHAGRGDDEVFPSGNGDSILGGNGDDRIVGGNGSFIGDANFDGTIAGDEAEDECLQADFEDGDDVISVSGDGDSLICSGDGDDRVTGASGADLILGGLGDDVLRGGQGNDVIGDRSNTSQDGSAACDANDEPGNDRIYGGDGKNRLCGGAGNDIIIGGDDDESTEDLEDGPGSDRLSGRDGPENYFLYPDDTADRVDAGDGDDQIGDADNPIPAFSGRDVIDCGNGEDEVYVDSNSDAVEAKTGEKFTSVDDDGDSLGSCETVNIE